MKTVRAIIKDFGGVTAMGHLIGVSPQGVANMRSRGSIPSEYWETLVAVAAERGIVGVTFEALARRAAKRRSPAASRRSGGRLVVMA